MPGGLIRGVSNVLFGRQRKAAPSVPPPSSTFRINAPGFEFQSGSGRSGTRTTSLQARGPTQAAFARRFPRILGDLDTLREQTAPGFSAFRKAGFDRLRSAREAATSNLSQSLARRNVLGSSFGQDALSRARAEFGQKEAEFGAQAALQEIQTTAAFVHQENQIITQNLLRELQAFGIAANLPIQIEQLMNQNAQIKVNAILGDEQASQSRSAATIGLLESGARGFGLAGFGGAPAPVADTSPFSVGGGFTPSGGIAPLATFPGASTGGFSF